MHLEREAKATFLDKGALIACASTGVAFTLLTQKLNASPPCFLFFNGAEPEMPFDELLLSLVAHKSALSLNL